MLFNSYSFLIFYLPIVVAGFFVLARIRHIAAAAWLALASIAFYGWWDYRYVPLLIGSILFNFFAARMMLRAIAGQRPRVLRGYLIVAVCFDLGLLAYFKYFNFFVDNVNALGGVHWMPARVILPIGISFFTFTQIAFLVDTYRREVSEYSLVHYGLFVAYFPHLIAGPVLHHKEMMPQFQSGSTYLLRSENFAVGLTFFSFGLFKKVLLADNFATYVRPVFDAQGTAGLGMLDCWAAALAYALQIYFDFSGYSDMAIGLSRLFGVRLPLNFNSPYKAANISEFWRRWHMTLSRFLRDYLYLPLGGNRKGKSRRYANLATTMVLGGLWHGAGWTYVIWGGLHGMYLVVHQFWQSVRPAKTTAASRWTKLASVLLTFLAVVVGWVFFRAPSASRALSMLAAMFGLDGIQLPEGWHAAVARLTSAAPFIANFFHFGNVPVLQDHGQILAILAGLIWIWSAPNAQEVMQRFIPALGVPPPVTTQRRQWNPTPLWALTSGILLAVALFNLTQVSDFLYFQF